MAEQLDYQTAIQNRRSIRRLSIRLLVMAASVLLLVWVSSFLQQINLVVQMRRDMLRTNSTSYAFKIASQPAGDGRSYVAGSFTYQQSGLKIFEHIRRSPTHAERILSVTASVDYRFGIPRLTLHADTFTLPTIWPGSRRQLLQGIRLNIDADKVFAGQADQTDPSHFTIKYELNDRADTIDGWLMADDTVKLEPRGKFTVVTTAPTSFPAQKN